MLVAGRFVRIVFALKLESLVVAAEDVVVKLAVTGCRAALASVESFAGGRCALFLAYDSILIPVTITPTAPVAQFDVSARWLLIRPKALHRILVVYAVRSLATGNWVAVLGARNFLKWIEANAGTVVKFALGAATIALREQLLARSITTKGHAYRESAGPFAIVRAVVLIT